MKRALVALGAMVSMLAFGAAPLSAAPANAAPANVPIGGKCAVFPDDNIWNTRVDTLPVNSSSDTWLSTMGTATTKLHPDFGRSPYGFPFAIVTNKHSKVYVKFRYSSESDHVKYPFGSDTPIEQGSDRHAIMVNTDTCTLYELFDAHWNKGKPTAGSGAMFHLGSDALRPDGWTSADAAGLPILPGLVRYSEVAAGFIGHAIRFTVDCTSQAHLWPARHDAGSDDESCPPMGARFRLKSSFDISSFTPDAQVVLLAMQQYGLILADNGSNWYFQGTQDKRWKDSLLDQLKTIPASQFEAVDESGCQVSADSAQAACP
jgi:hypothetical protein